MAYLSGVDNIRSSSTTVPPRFDNTSGTELGRLCRASINFAPSGFIYNSFNVTSVTKTATGSFQVNFTRNMPNYDYCTVVSAYRTNGGGYLAIPARSFDSTKMNIYVTNLNNTAVDPDAINAAFFG